MNLYRVLTVVTPNALPEGLSWCPCNRILIEVIILFDKYRNVDEEAGEVYFDRTKQSTTGNLKWKFDFSSSGLLVNEVTIRLNYLDSHGGEITTTIVGDSGKRVHYLKGIKTEWNAYTIVLSIYLTLPLSTRTKPASHSDAMSAGSVQKNAGSEIPNSCNLCDWISFWRKSLSECTIISSFFVTFSHEFLFCTYWRRSCC